MGDQELPRKLNKINTSSCPFLDIEVTPMYWEDASINGVEDEFGTLVPLRDGDAWKIIVDLKTGEILNWPVGISASIHYKICDQGQYWLTDQYCKRIFKWNSYYVPDDILCVGDRGYGDYIIFNVDYNGHIKNWLHPVLDPIEWKLI